MAAFTAGTKPKCPKPKCPKPKCPNQTCFVIKVFEGEIDIFVAMQQIVASIGHWLLNINSLVYWSEKREAKYSCVKYK